MNSTTADTATDSCTRNPCRECGFDIPNDAEPCLSCGWVELQESPFPEWAVSKAAAMTPAVNGHVKGATSYELGATFYGIVKSMEDRWVTAGGRRVKRLRCDFADGRWIFVTNAMFVGMVNALGNDLYQWAGRTLRFTVGPSQGRYNRRWNVSVPGHVPLPEPKRPHMDTLTVGTPDRRVPDTVPVTDTDTVPAAVSVSVTAKNGLDKNGLDKNGLDKNPNRAILAEPAPWEEA